MITTLSIQYDTSQNSRSISSYQISMAPTDQAPTGALCQVGDVWNNIATYTGVFDTQQAAVMAALGYISAPFFRLLELDTAGAKRLVIQSMDAKRLALDEFTTARVIGSKTDHGMFVATGDRS